MSHINFIPWREALKQKHKQQYLGVLGVVAVLMLGLMFAIGSGINKLIENQRIRNTYITQQTQVLDAQIGKIKTIKEDIAALEQRMALIEQLQTSRNVATNIMDELARLVPPGIAFRSLSRSGNNMKVLGISESNNRLADFMRRLEASTVFIDGELSSIIADTTASDAVSEFKLTFTISPKVAPNFAAVGEVKASK